MKSLTFKIDFFEAHFKVHTTKGFRLSYPIPPPTSVAGIFAAALGLDREAVYDEFHDFIFGACCCNTVPEQSVEQATFIQYKEYRRGVAPTHILVNPSYYLTMAGDDAKVEKFRTRFITQGIEFQPFGGQNDYFARDWAVVESGNLTKSKEVANYLPVGHIERIQEGTILEVLPIRHRLPSVNGVDEIEPEFCFIMDGRVISKKESDVCIVDGKSMALYRLGDFELYGEAKHAD
jgi:CRISPR-associated Cas5-like protein